MVLTFIFGGLGSGKTLLAIIMAYLSSKKNDTLVKANLKITFGEYINPIELLDFELRNTILIMDELASFIDSRTNTIAQRGISYFFSQSRKRTVEVIGTAQLESMSDKRFTDISDIKIKCKSRNPYLKEDFYYIVDDLRYDAIYSMEIKYNDAKQYFDMYDTEEIVNPLSITSKDVLTGNQLKAIFNESPTKKTFIADLRLENPYISQDTCGAVYDHLKSGNMEKARRLLRI